MSENLAAWHRPQLGKVQTQLMPPTGDLLLDLSLPHGGRQGRPEGLSILYVLLVAVFVLKIPTTCYYAITIPKHKTATIY